MALACPNHNTKFLVWLSGMLNDSTPLSCNTHLSICEEMEMSYWEMVTDATLNNRVEWGYLAPHYVCNRTSSRLGLLVLPELWHLVMGKPLLPL